MKIQIKNVLFASLFIASVASVSALEQAHDILGVGLSMTEKQARTRLQEIGEFVRQEDGWQEVWKVRDENYSHLIVGFGKDEKLNFITAVAREDKEARRVLYSAIGDVKQARQEGDPKIKNFKFQWEAAAGKNSPHHLILAAGRDPKYLATHSLKNLENAPAKKEKD